MVEEGGYISRMDDAESWIEIFVFRVFLNVKVKKYFHSRGRYRAGYRNLGWIKEEN